MAAAPNNKSNSSFSFSVAMTSERINSFAKATGDFNQVHFDADAARALFGSACTAPVVPGMLVISCAATGIVERLKDGTMLREVGAWKPKNFVMQDEIVEYEAWEADRSVRGRQVFIEIATRMFFTRNGNRMEFSKDPISVWFYRTED